MGNSLWVRIDQVGGSGPEEAVLRIEPVLDELIHELLEHPAAINTSLLFSKLVNKGDF